MSTKIKVICAAAALAAVVGLYFGGSWYLDQRRREAERQANACLDRFFTACEEDHRGVNVKEKIKGLCAEMAALEARCGDAMRRELFVRRMDGAFLAGDYAQAEAMMDAIPGRTDNWKLGAKAKIRAHAALARGDKATALKEFGAFVETLRREEMKYPEVDPATGAEWPKAALLARNELRMSKLAADIGRQDEAAKLLASAKANFKAALAALTDEDSKKAVAAELGELAR